MVSDFHMNTYLQDWSSLALLDCPDIIMNKNNLKSDHQAIEGHVFPEALLSLEI